MELKQTKIIELLKDRSIKYKDIALECKCSREYVEIIARRNNLQRRKCTPKNKIILSEEEINECINLYKNNYSIKNISLKLNKDKSVIKSYLAESGVKLKNRYESHEIYAKNNIFKEIDNEYSAYFLGLLFADGNISGSSNTVSISLIETEKNLLEKFSELIFGQIKLFKIEPKKKEHSIAYRLSFSNFEIKNSLNKLGCYPKKSLTCKFPDNNQVPESLLHHFIRGYFDGDGGLGSKSNVLSICYSDNFSEILQNILKNKNINGTIEKEGKITKYFIRNIINIKKFTKFIYQDATIWCERKRKRLEEISLKINDIYLNRFIIRKDNKEIKIDNIFSFCKENNIFPCHVLKYLNRERGPIKGFEFRIENSDFQPKYIKKIHKKRTSFYHKLYTLEYKNGETIKIENLKLFCLQNKITYDGIRKTLYRNNFYKGMRLLRKQHSFRVWN